MNHRLTFHGESPALDRGAGLVTLVHGASFALSGANGDIGGSLAEGLFMMDRRMVSQLVLEVDGRGLEGLTVDHPDPHEALFVLRESHSPDRPAPLLVTRRRRLDAGLSETITLANHALASRRVVVQLEVGSDFADLFSVKRGDPAGALGAATSTENCLQFDAAGDDIEVTVVSSQPCGIGSGVMVWPLEIAPGESWEVSVSVTVRHQGSHVGWTPRRSTIDLLPAAPRLTCDDDRVVAAWSRGVRDLGSLVLSDPDHPDVPFVAAGAPWFMTLFGRDSLWTSWMCLGWNTELAAGVLATLARIQGTESIAATEEEPGRILHEVRAIGGSDRLANSEIYYGTIDATPLFVVMVAEAARWGLDRETIARLMPAVDAAMGWIDARTVGGTEWLRYERTSIQGLENQGWKDSWDAIAFPDGQLAKTPISLVEVQGYVFAALRARAELAEWCGDTATAARCRSIATAWRARFVDAFWLDDDRGLALAIERDGRLIDAIASNSGHVLWSGILDSAKAELVADQLVGPTMFSGFGLRTLAEGHARYDPLSYHNGSVWPHDTAIAASGMMRYGLTAQASVIIEGLLDAADIEDGRLPELFSGLDRTEVGRPVPYPTSCSPQAWSSATGLLIAKLLLGLDPNALTTTLTLHEPPLGPMALRLDGLRIGGRDVVATRTITSVSVAGLDGWTIDRAPA